MSSIIMPRGIIKPPGLVLDLPMQGEIVGADLFDPGAGRYETDTGSWIKYLNNTIEVSTDIAHSGSQSLKITCVDDGRGAYLTFEDATDLFTNLTVGKKYRMILWTAVDTGDSVSIDVYNGSSTVTVATITSTTMIKVEYDFIAQSATGCYVKMLNMAPGEIIYIDDLTLQELYTPDVSGLGNHGTVNGPTVAQGLRGGCFDFDGADDLIDFGNPSALQFTDKFSVMCWYNADAWNAWAALLTKTDTSFGVGWGIYRSSSTGNIRFLVESGSGIIDYAFLPTDEWHHICGTYFKGDLKLYIDAILVGTDDGATAITDNTNNFQAGFQAGGGYFNGRIDKIKLFNRALTEAQIQYEMYRSAILKPVMNGGVLWPN